MGDSAVEFRIFVLVPSSMGLSNKVRCLKCDLITPPCLSSINDRWEVGRGYDVTFETSDLVARTRRVGSCVEVYTFGEYEKSFNFPVRFVHLKDKIF